MRRDLVRLVEADLAHVALNPTSALPTIGASGAIAGVMGTYCIFFPATRIRHSSCPGSWKIPAFVYLGGWVAFQRFEMALWSSLGTSGDVAWGAHVGGFAAGGALALAFRRVSLPFPERNSTGDGQSSLS